MFESVDFECSALQKFLALFGYEFAEDSQSMQGNAKSTCSFRIPANVLSILRNLEPGSSDKFSS